MLTKIINNKKIREDENFKARGGFTAYQLGLQLVDAPPTTVSEHFAGELTTDRLQTGHFADHLQEILKQSGVVGVNNGMFINFPPDFSKRGSATPTYSRSARCRSFEASSQKFAEKTKFHKVLVKVWPPAFIPPHVVGPPEAKEDK